MTFIFIIKINMSFLCEYCNLLYTTKNNLTRHQNTNKCKNRINLLNKEHRIYNENIKNRDNIVPS